MSTHSTCTEPTSSYSGTVPFSLLSPSPSPPSTFLHSLPTPFSPSLPPSFSCTPFSSHICNHMSPFKPPLPHLCVPSLSLSPICLKLYYSLQLLLPTTKSALLILLACPRCISLVQLLTTTSATTNTATTASRPRTKPVLPLLVRALTFDPRNGIKISATPAFTGTRTTRG